MEQPNFNNQEAQKKEGKSITNKVKNIIGIGTLAVAAAIAGAPNDVEAKTAFGVPRAYNPELLKSINLDSSAQEFFKENSLSLQVFKNPTNAPGKTAVCILAQGIAMFDVCFLEDVDKANLSYDRIKRILSVNLTIKDGSREEYKLLPKFDNGGQVVDFLD